MPFLERLGGDDILFMLGVMLLFFFIAWVAKRKMKAGWGTGILVAAGIYLVLGTGGWALVIGGILYGIYVFFQWVFTE